MLINNSDKKHILKFAKDVFQTLRDRKMTPEQLINSQPVGHVSRYKWMLTFTLFDFYDIDFSAKLSSAHKDAKLTCPRCHGPLATKGPVGKNSLDFIFRWFQVCPNSQIFLQRLQRCDA